MNASDLMIGDWVQHEEGVCKVISIATNGIYFEDSVSEGVATIDRIHPILITPEILEKNGFEKYGKPHFNLQQWVIKAGKRNVSIVQELTREGWCFKDIWITYVHELQHALRLCGIEKTIEL